MEDRSVLERPAPAPALTVRYGDGPEHLADVWPGGAAAADRPLAVMVHGGFWRPEYDRLHTRPLCAALAAAGWTAVSVEYRRRPGDPDATVQDVAAALAALPVELAGRVPFDGRTAVLGHSAGGHLALWAAAAAPAPGLAGTVALAPVADLALAHRLDLDGGAVADFLGGGPEGRADLDPVRLAAPAAPVVLVHGTADAVVPPSLTESYTAAHPAARAVPVPGAGHFALIDPLSPAWTAVLAALASLDG
ncbi:alpha/beta hydrolase [Kitasatospora sp. NPDC059571]|uniref:alpha/beta hydrolase n=1 Tax=Kitasatospora sp. NPDC059571 TaxID=3346871 RepID=UPI0036ABCBFE